MTDSTDKTKIQFNNRDSNSGLDKTRILNLETASSNAPEQDRIVNEPHRLLLDAIPSLSQEALLDLSSRFVPKNYAPGQLLLQQGSVGTELILLASGAVEVLLETHDTQARICLVGSGAILGEMSLLTGEPCTANAKAVNEVEAYALTREDYESLQKTYPELEIALSQLVGDRLGSQARDALTGKMINGYRLTRCINRGGMGVVYEAVDRQGRRVAMKMLQHQFVREPAIVDAFLKEGKLLSEMQHPHIVYVRDYFVAYNTRFFVMDFWEGADFKSILMQRRKEGLKGLSNSFCQNVLKQVANALKYAHERRILHLDIKPANLLASGKDVVALADFGLCRAVGSSAADSQVVGTIPYMPPEQFENLNITPAADHYALACTMVELLTGERLFNQETVEQVREAKLLPPNRLLPHLDCTPNLFSFILSCLEPSPNQRDCTLLFEC